MDMIVHKVSQMIKSGGGCIDLEEVTNKIPVVSRGSLGDYFDIIEGPVRRISLKEGGGGREPPAASPEPPGSMAGGSSYAHPHHTPDQVDDY